MSKFKKLPIDEQGEFYDSVSKLQSPRNLVIVSFPKAGKTASMINVPNILIGDTENGTQYFDARNVANLLEGEKDFVKISSGAYIPGGIYETVEELNALNKMDEYWKLARLSEVRGVEGESAFKDLVAHLRGMKFPIFVIDTITSIQELNNMAALAEYNEQHPTKQKTNIKRIDDWGGVQNIRRNFVGLKQFIENNAAPFIIWNGHVAEKKKVLKKGETEISAVDIALDGLLSTMFTSRADSVCIFYRNDKGCFLDFTRKDETDLGSRPQHLSNRIIKVSDLDRIDKEGKILEKGKTYWDIVYPDLVFNK